MLCRMGEEQRMKIASEVDDQVTQTRSTSGARSSSMAAGGADKNSIGENLDMFLLRAAGGSRADAKGNQE